MTEDKAKEKWCPFRHEAGVQGEHEHAHATRCIASGCMMWRHFTLDDQMRGFDSKGGGYCGLASNVGAN